MPDGTVIVDQDEYRRSLKPIYLDKARLPQESSPVTPTELELFRSLVGGLAWLTMTRSDVCVGYSSTTEDDLRDCE